MNRQRYPDPPGTVAVAWWWKDGEWIIDNCAPTEEALREKIERTRHLFSAREHRIEVYSRESLE
jgi:hypothetical protein